MKKMSFDIAKSALSREEMRMISGGSGAGCLDMKCGSKHPGNVCCPQNTCSSLTDGHCVLN